MSWTKISPILIVSCIILFHVHAQSVVQIHLKNGAVEVVQSELKSYPVSHPLFSFRIDDQLILSSSKAVVSWQVVSEERIPGGLKMRLRFSNISADTVLLSNVVPFGESKSRVYITGLGNNRLSRTHLFIPGRQPVNVIVPDNAWELGYGMIELDQFHSAYGLARREVSSILNGNRKRFETELLPGGSVEYYFYFEMFSGVWRTGLVKCFRDRKLYDLEIFNDRMYQRTDLNWIRRAYVMHLLMAWDKSYYDFKEGKFNLHAFVERGRRLYGGDDVICLWPTWPSLGLDHRNQFDLYRDLPGGIAGLRTLADTLRKLGTRFFIAYNPWDEGTRKEDHLKGLESLIRDTGADGVVLDTRGNSSKELQEAADRVRPGVVMYSEGMAVPKDMQDIVSGRVHNALYYPPMLNLNKLIQPSFSIFRVAEVFKEPIQREYATSFFNGYGTEINQFTPGHPEWEEDQYLYLGKTSMILRDHTSNFSSENFIPLIETETDQIWVNQFSTDSKSVYAIYSVKPEGYEGSLFEAIEPFPGHWVDIWNHHEITPVKQGSKKYISVTVDGFSGRWLSTNNEGQNGCIAYYPEILSVTIKNGIIDYNCNREASIRIWKGSPDYSKKPFLFRLTKNQIAIREIFGGYEGRIVIQAVDDDGEVIDERIIQIEPGTPILTSTVVKTAAVKTESQGMVRIPPGKFKFQTTCGDKFIRYPDDPQDAVKVNGFYMDRFPVTNQEFYDFIKSSNYRPDDTVNFLKHWKSGKPQKGEEKHPVVYISMDDILAYCRWAGKRLPTEQEWQYAAQAGTNADWPWKQTEAVRREKQFVNETLTTTRLIGIDPKMTNIGDDRLHPVGDFPKGANLYGLQDLVGSVWQLTNDVYESGSYRYVIMKGGSYFKPSASWWYVQGGPRELHYRQYLLLVSAGFERNSTVGFRCVRDF